MARRPRSPAETASAPGTTPPPGRRAADPRQPRREPDRQARRQRPRGCPARWRPAPGRACQAAGRPGVAHVRQRETASMRQDQLVAAPAGAGEPARADVAAPAGQRPRRRDAAGVGPVRRRARTVPRRRCRRSTRWPAAQAGSAASAAASRRNQRRCVALAAALLDRGTSGPRPPPAARAAGPGTRS